MAWLVDVIIRMAILFAIYLFLSFFTSEREGSLAVMGLWYIMIFLVSWFYTTLFEALTGSTPGKRQFGLWVVHDNGTPITASGAVIRNFLRAADGLPFLNVVGLITMLIDNRFRRLGDLAAGTLVIYREEVAVTPDLKFTHSQPPPEWLSRDERQAIVDFAERCESLSEDRQRELASVLAPLLGEEQTDAVHTLKSWAQWIVRGQVDAEPASV